MEELRMFSLSELIDLLSQHTYAYTKMFRQGITRPQNEHYKRYINNIIAEIETRKKADEQTGSPGDQ